MTDFPAERAPAQATRPDRDHRPGLRTLLVPRFLSKGLTQAQAAHVSGVPLPLVTLIAEEATAPASPRSHTRPHGSPHQSGHVPTRGRRSATSVRLVFVAAIAAGCAGSILWHEPILPIILIVTGSLAGYHLRTPLTAARQHAPRTGTRP
ncbi:hypothetical protein [Pseudarthrobacter sp. NPDC080039]|uniref:hypothetical protein n=1 Tax=unclassified Pseudarthrobacter TaxID=2647000 RepID=UPI00344B8C83